MKRRNPKWNPETKEAKYPFTIHTDSDKGYTKFIGDLNKVKFYWFGNNKFEEVTAKNYNTISFNCDVIFGTSYMYFIEDKVFGCDGRYSLEFLQEKVEEFRNENRN